MRLSGSLFSGYLKHRVCSMSLKPFLLSGIAAWLLAACSTVSTPPASGGAVARPDLRQFQGERCQTEISMQAGEQYVFELKPGEYARKLEITGDEIVGSLRRDGHTEIYFIGAWDINRNLGYLEATLDTAGHYTFTVDQGGRGSVCLFEMVPWGMSESGCRDVGCFDDQGKNNPICQPCRTHFPHYF